MASVCVSAISFCNLLGLQICVVVLNATVFDNVDNVSWYFLCFPNRMCYPDSNNLSVGFLITVCLSAGDAVLPDIAIKTKNIFFLQIR